MYLERLQQLDNEYLFYHSPKPRPDGTSQRVLIPLACPIGHAQMRIVTFIDDASTVHKILDRIGESTQPPIIAPARG